MGDLHQILKDYPGYDKPENRRTSDEALRAYLVRLISDFLNQVSSLESYLSSHKMKDRAQRARRAEEEIELLYDKIQVASYSFSLFFKIENLPEEQREMITNNDYVLVDAADWIQKRLEPTLSDNTNFDALLDTVFDLIYELHDQIESRLTTIIEFRG